MIQDIAPLRLKNQYKEAEMTAESSVIGFANDKIILRTEGAQITYMTYGELLEVCRKQGKKVPRCRFLFSIGDATPAAGDADAAGDPASTEDAVDAAGDVDYFLADFSGLELPAGYEEYDMFSIRSMKPKELVFAGATAWHLFIWYRDNRWCGRCGERLFHEAGMRAMRCKSCGNIVFPKIAPAVIVAVTDGENLLMTKYAGRQYKRYALIAGFTEIGETAEETVAREVFEETGVHVKNIRYYKSQPWGFDSNLLLGYFCELDGDAGITMDAEELSVAEWVHYSEIPGDPEGLSLTREMMTRFKERFGENL